MATFQSSAARKTKPPPLVHGERLDQRTFHERYAAMPPHVRAELIGGMVYMSSPQKAPHGKSQGILGQWVGEYEEKTPGVEQLTNSTNILGDDKEPQPDESLFVLPEYGGQVWRDEQEYLCGSPDLLGEVSDSTEKIDLGLKKLDYERAGIREYIVVALRQKKVFWFIRRRGKFRELKAGADGIFRSQAFPGLWLDGEALLRGDRKRVLAVLREGLATQEHADFARELERKRVGKK